MRKARIVVGTAAFVLLAFGGSPAKAWTCQTEPLPLTPDPGAVACGVVMNGVGAACKITKIFCPL